MPANQTAHSQAIAVGQAPDPRTLAVGLVVGSARFTRLAARETSTAIPRALWRALAVLEDLGPTRVSDLAVADRVTQPTATTLVQQLVERGWARRGRNTKDRRVVKVTITDAGRAALTQARDSAAEALLPRLRRLDPDQLLALAAGLEVLNLIVEGDAQGGPSDP